MSRRFYLILWVIAAGFYFATGTIQWAIAMWALAILSALESAVARLERR